MDVLRDFLADALDAEFTVFLAALDRVPAAQFSQPAYTAHSAAWHALHIADWTRATIRPGLSDAAPALTYGYLGSEAEAWAQAVTGPIVAHETDPRDTVPTAVAAVFRGAVRAVRDAPPERFDPDATFQVLHRLRPVRGSLSSHLRHTAYHRGQVTHILKEFVHDPVPSLPA
ncbi:DinB family protein [Deinococcus sp. Leaf326]|uniref:DinB family protein n=1 Tax=Deinococcus sp. Leaf326 TaxID=1736338 RepID=UPI0006FA987D|nr:DinB family protein [Deinococcus sp. Leaf326]KQR15711.1 hypothetical protein ASF71_08805 [Deinococcus sp. Leaf326]